jgi:hypothetical protein
VYRPRIPVPFSLELFASFPYYSTIDYQHAHDILTLLVYRPRTVGSFLIYRPHIYFGRNFRFIVPVLLVLMIYRPRSFGTF